MFRELGVKGRVLLRRNRWLQLLGLFGIWWVSDFVARTLGLPVPGSLIGLAVLLLLLASGRLPSILLSRGASGYLDHLLLFFVPATMTLLDHRELLGFAGLKVLGAILVGTALVMTGTALTVELCLRWKARHGH